MSEMAQTELKYCKWPREAPSEIFSKSELACRSYEGFAKVVATSLKVQSCIAHASKLHSSSIGICGKLFYSFRKSYFSKV